MKKLNRCSYILLLLGFQIANAGDLYIFVPSDIRAKVLQDKISAVCTDVNVTVFGRVKDFSNKLKSDPPHGIVALSPVIGNNPTFTRLLQGFNKGAEKEPYYLVSVDTPLDRKALSGKKLGVVDILGRKGMKKYVTEVLSPDVKIKSVTKVDDLLPLLSFKAVDAIFVSQSVLEKVKSKTQLSLHATKLDINIGLASTALASDKDSKDISKCVQSLPKDVNSAIGVESWKNL